MEARRVNPPAIEVGGWASIVNTFRIDKIFLVLVNSPAELLNRLRLELPSVTRLPFFQFSGLLLVIPYPLRYSITTSLVSLVSLVSQVGIVSENTKQAADRTDVREAAPPKSEPTSKDEEVGYVN